MIRILPTPQLQGLGSANIMQHQGCPAAACDLHPNRMFRDGLDMPSRIASEHMQAGRLRVDASSSSFSFSVSPSLSSSACSLSLVRNTLGQAHGEAFSGS